MVASILDSIITEFDLSKFEIFFRQKSDTYTPEDEELSHYNNDLFSQVTKLGQMQCDTVEVAVISCKVERNLTERSSKKAQYILGKKTLRFLDRYAGGFFIFYDSAGNFRFSFIYSIPQATGRREWSNFRRFTYYVSIDQTNKTFKQQMDAASFATVDDIIQAFSVEKVTKEFYQQIVALYNTLMSNDKEGLQKYPGNKDEKQEFGVRLLGRLLFCWFLKKKKDNNNEAIVPEQLLSSKIVSQYDDIYHELLEPLFFQVLNTPIDHRLDTYRNDHWQKIPFLNGGLFEPHHSDYYNPNGMGISQFINTLRIDNNWFKSVFELFEQYNFTIDENSTVDAEISIDPEMLGRIFENLLAEINPETGESARKATGSYYTPREIVEYMVDESLKHYLLQKTGIDEQIINALFEYDVEDVEIDEQKKDAIIDALDTIKVLDPACGSGAFPMGMLHKMVAVLQKVDPSSQKWLNKKIQQIPDPLIRKELEQKVKGENWEYIHKLGIIQNAIFGVDIQPIAIEISKLRFFLSLMVDEAIDDSKPNRGIIPLPNLEFKFVAANTLIELTPFDDNFSYFGNPQDLIDKLKSLRMQYFSSYGNKKKEIESEFKNTQNDLFNLAVQWQNSEHQAYALSQWDPFSFTSNEWFDPEWMFGISINSMNGGFDIVIGNPPYIQLQKDKGKLANLYKDKNYQTFTRVGDIYVLFYERGMQLLKDGGILAYITSNKWMRAGYGEKLRQYFTQYNPKVLIDLGPGVFESATVDTNILLIEKKKGDSNWRVQAVTLMRKNNEPISIKEQLATRGTELTKLTKDAWFIGSNAEQRLKEKIEHKGKPLKDWDVKIYRGVLTGLNEAFIITTEKRNEILANCKDEEERKRTEAIIKPILRGRDIKRYYYEWAGLWVIVIPAGYTEENRNNQDPERFINKQYYSLMQHLKQFKNKAQKRDDQGDYWWELRQCAYYHEFEKEKVVWASVGETYYCWVDKEFLLMDTNYFTNCLNKWQLGILNSKLIISYINGLDTLVGEIAYRHYKYNFEKIPIPPITSDNEPVIKQIETLVDNILKSKKNNTHADTTHLEREIDQLVYRLYDLTEDEIRIVEGE